MADVSKINGYTIKDSNARKQLLDLIPRIEQLESATLQFTEDSSVAYEKIVPANSAKYALVNKVGGMTTKYPASTNLFGGVSKEENSDGVKAVFNYDGTIVLNGTGGYSTFHLFDEGAEGMLSFANITDDFPIGTVAIHYTHFNQDEGYAEEDWEEPLTKDTLIYLGYYEISLIVMGTVNNLTLYPMHSKGGVPLPYEPYYEGLRDTKVTELVSEGANLLPRATRNAQTINGVTFTVQEDNSIIANGTATADASFEILRGGMGEKITLDKGETYTLSGCPKGGSSSTYRMVVQNTGYAQNYTDIGEGGTAIANYSDYYAFIRISAGYTANNLVFKPMFVRGSVAQPYLPYGTIVDTFPISAELRAFLEPLGYGRGVNAEHNNYIDFERKVFVQNTYRKVFDGSERIAVTGETKYDYEQYSTPISPIVYDNTDVIQCVATHYAPAARYQVGDRKANGLISASGEFIRWTDEHMTAEEMQAKLKAWYDEGNPLIVEYRLATPVETDISAYLTDDNFIAVEGGGTIKAVNEFEFDAPTTIAYVSQKGS